MDRAGDEHVLAQHGTKGRMDGVAERIENARDVAGDGRSVMPHVGHRHRNVVGESSRAVDAHTQRAGAEVTAGEAVAAASADDVPFGADDVAGKEVGNVRPYLDDFPTNSWPTTMEPDGLRRPFIPLVDMNVGAQIAAR